MLLGETAQRPVTLRGRNRIGERVIVRDVRFESVPGLDHRKTDEFPKLSHALGADLGELMLQHSETKLLVNHAPIVAPIAAGLTDPFEVFLGQRQLSQLNIELLRIGEALGRDHALPTKITGVLAKLEPAVDPAIAKLELGRHLQGDFDVLKLFTIKVLGQHRRAYPGKTLVSPGILGGELAHRGQPAIAVDHQAVARDQQRFGLPTMPGQFLVDGASGSRALSASRSCSSR